MKRSALYQQRTKLPELPWQLLGSLVPLFWQSPLSSHRRTACRSFTS